MIEQRRGTSEVLEAVLEGASVRVSCTEYVGRRLGCYIHRSIQRRGLMADADH